MPTFAGLIAVVLTLCDYAFHCRNGVLGYTEVGIGFFAPQPSLEVFKGFMQIGVAVTLSALVIFHKMPPPGLVRSLASVAVFIFTYGCSGWLKDWHMGLYVGIMSLWAAHLVLLFETYLPQLVCYSVLLGVLGPVVEGHAASIGFFHYNPVHVHAYFVPIWLTAIYFHGALAVAACVSTLWSWRSCA
jgi:hypothetical protein